MQSNAKKVYEGCILPAISSLPAKMGSRQAQVILLAITGQEADFHHRWQVVDAKNPAIRGPARGLAQFELGGGVRGVLTHPASREYAYAACEVRGLKPVAAAVHPALETDDTLAMIFARLLMWTDAYKLPQDEEGSWQLYLRTWRPGAWDRGTAEQKAKLRRKWSEYYRVADEVVA